eukprot:1145469-Pelagomonas_calceolata.AAC.5
MKKLFIFTCTSQAYTDPVHTRAHTYIHTQHTPEEHALQGPPVRLGMHGLMRAGFNTPGAAYSCMFSVLQADVPPYAFSCSCAGARWCWRGIHAHARAWITASSHASPCIPI